MLMHVQRNTTGDEGIIWKSLVYDGEEIDCGPSTIFAFAMADHDRPDQILASRIGSYSIDDIAALYSDMEDRLKSVVRACLGLCGKTILHILANRNHMTGTEDPIHRPNSTRLGRRRCCMEFCAETYCGNQHLPVRINVPIRCLAGEDLLYHAGSCQF